MPSKKGAKDAKKEPRHPKRRIKQPTYKSFKYSKKLRQTKPPIMGSFRLLTASARLLTKNWKLFGGIVLVYLVLTLVLVKTFNVSSNSNNLYDSVRNLFQGNTADLVSGLAIFSIILGNSSSASSEGARAYQTMMQIMISLVFIWALRQTLSTSKKNITIRDAFYNGVYPFVPFLLVLMIIGLQLIPLMLSSYFYLQVFGGGLAVTVLEKALWLLLLLALATLSLYLITSSIFALYISTLPGMKPVQALKSARDLVRHRRLTVIRRIVFLPVAVIIITGLITVPVIMLQPTLAEWLFFAISMLWLAIGHSYLYHLYRELL